MSDLENPLLFLTIAKVEGIHLTDTQGRRFLDFSTQRYLAFQLDERITEAQIQGIKDYGNVVTWSRTVASFEIFEKAEEKLAEFVGFEATNLFPSTTLLNHGIIPVLAGFEGAMIAFETYSYPSSYEGALLAKAKGAEIKTWKNEGELAELLKQPYQKKLVVTDGVHSMSGNFANLPKLQELCKKYDAYLYVDDAHGFGVVGENPSVEHPLGHRGNGLIKYYGLSHENIFYVGCLSKAFCLPGGFIACSKKEREYFLSNATPHDLSSAGETSAIVGIIKALEVNESAGDRIRSELISMSDFLRSNLQSLGFIIYGNHSHFPIVTVAFKDHALFLKACHYLYQNGILPTTEPNHKHNEEILHLFRFTITGAHQMQDIDVLINTFREFKNKFIN